MVPADIDITPWRLFPSQHCKESGGVLNLFNKGWHLNKSRTIKEKNQQEKKDNLLTVSLVITIQNHSL